VDGDAKRTAPGTRSEQLALVEQGNLSYRKLSATIYFDFMCSRRLTSNWSADSRRIKPARGYSTSSMT